MWIICENLLPVLRTGPLGKLGTGPERTWPKSGLITFNLNLDPQQSNGLSHAGSSGHSTRCSLDCIFGPTLFYLFFRTRLLPNGLPFMKNSLSLPKVTHYKKFRISSSSVNCRCFSRAGRRRSPQTRTNRCVCGQFSPGLKSWNGRAVTDIPSPHAGVLCLQRL